MILKQNQIYEVNVDEISNFEIEELRVIPYAPSTIVIGSNQKRIIDVDDTHIYYRFPASNNNQESLVAIDKDTENDTIPSSSRIFLPPTEMGAGSGTDICIDGDDIYYMGNREVFKFSKNTANGSTAVLERSFTLPEF